jgi:Electron transfer DM13
MRLKGVQPKPCHLAPYMKDCAMSPALHSSPARTIAPLAPLALILALVACGGGGAEPAATPQPPAAAACSKSNAKIGQVATLSTRSHNVKGQAKIIDDCTLEISNFSYDGGGLSKVFVYGGKGGNYAAGFPIGPNLKGTVYNNQVLRVTLQAGDLERLDGISIWCTDANANFGDGRFAAL